MSTRLLLLYIDYQPSPITLHVILAYGIMAVYVTEQGTQTRMNNGNVTLPIYAQVTGLIGVYCHLIWTTKQCCSCF